jgi:predicted amidohydrolase YtcJ
VKGSIEVGKYADLTVFSGRLLDIDPEEWPQLRPELTVVDGQVLFEQEA